MPTADQLLADKMAEFRNSPTGPLDYVMFNFPWGEDPDLQRVELQEPWVSRYGVEHGPDVWACKFLDRLGEEIVDRGFDGTESVDAIQFSTASGHGIGKSTLVSWLIMYIMDTRPWSMGVVTANTGDQLRTKTWAELAKWHHRALTSHFWDYSNSRGAMSLVRRGSAAVRNKWRTDALTARAENAEAFQGLHAASATPFYIFDEASGIEDEIWEARFGGATDGEPMTFDFGNPTRKSGYFFENTIGRYAKRYITQQIDSRSVQITNKNKFKEWEEDWGEDSDMFRVKVKGQFPRAGTLQFIPSDIVDAAVRRFPAQAQQYDPLIIGVDVARFGDNDTVIYPRIGMDAKSFPYKKFNGLDTVQVTEKVIETLQEFQRLGRKCNALFVDGGGLGAGVVDLLRRLGCDPIDINFGGRSGDDRYRRKVDEMWGRLKENLEHLAIPDDAILRDQLTQREYSYNENSGKIFLESKKDMKERLAGLEHASPDVADALALTFASPAMFAMDSMLQDMVGGGVKSEYNPWETNW